MCLKLEHTALEKFTGYLVCKACNECNMKQNIVPKLKCPLDSYLTFHLEQLEFMSRPRILL